jgi:hypothetical protein
MTIAWYDPTNHHVSTDKNDPLFTPLGQLWPLVVQTGEAWPCLIDTADFSKGTVTILMRCTDYTVSTGKHWLCTTPLQENT